MMRKIKVCERLANGSLRILDEKRLKTRLDEETMTVYVTYQRKQYEVRGSIYASYIQVR